MPPRLYAGHLDFPTKEQQLRDTFAEHGDVLSASPVLDRPTGRSRGFALVEYTSDCDALRAIGALHGTALDGRELTVNVGRPRSEPRIGRDRDARSDYTPRRRR